MNEETKQVITHLCRLSPRKLKLHVKWSNQILTLITVESCPAELTATGVGRHFVSTGTVCAWGRCALIDV